MVKKYFLIFTAFVLLNFCILAKPLEEQNPEVKSIFVLSEKILHKENLTADEMIKAALNFDFVQPGSDYEKSYLEKFRTYEMTLREWDSERTLKLYVHALKFEMDRVCDRKEYRRVVGHLHGLEAYPGGGEETRKLTAYWHEYHKRRPAMKDELCRAGYPEQ